MVCTFFGHKDAPDSIEPVLFKTITDVIENMGVNKFYVGNQGKFDGMVRRILKNLKAKYPYIDYAVVLAYMPIKKDDKDYSDTIFPDGLENVLQKYAINKRNYWMINKSDIVVTYVVRYFGGAAKFKEIAEKRGKKIINIYECEI